MKKQNKTIHDGRYQSGLTDLLNVTVGPERPLRGSWLEQGTHQGAVGL